MVKLRQLLFAVLPCVPGLTLLLAGFLDNAAPSTPGPSPETAVRGPIHALQTQPLFAAGVIVLLAGTMIGAFIVWRIGHPRPDPVDTDDGPPPTE